MTGHVSDRYVLIGQSFTKDDRCSDSACPGIEGMLVQFYMVSMIYYHFCIIQVNNAGDACFKTIRTSSVEDMDRMYRMHVRAPYLLIKLALPHLLRRKGGTMYELIIKL